MEANYQNINAFYIVIFFTYNNVNLISVEQQILILITVF